MKRGSFLKLGLALGSIISSSLKVNGTPKSKFREKKGFKVDAGKDRFDKSLTPFEGDTFYCKVSAKDTDGDLYIFESSRDIEGGPFLHVHYDQDEWWHVLEGEFLIRVGETTYNAKAGDFVFGPRKVPHTFAKVGKGKARLMMGFQPAGKMEELFQKLTDGVAKNMSEAERDKFRKDHGFERVGPPLTNLKQ